MAVTLNLLWLLGAVVYAGCSYAYDMAAMKALISNTPQGSGSAQGTAQAPAPAAAATAALPRKQR